MRNLKVNRALLLALVAGGTITFTTSFGSRKVPASHAEMIPNNSEKQIVEQTETYSSNNIEIDNQVYQIEEETNLETILSPFEEKLNYEYIDAVEATTGVNIRKGPSTEYDVIGGLTPGSRLPIINEYSEWYRVDYFGKEAFVNKNYVKKTRIITGTPEKVVYCHEDTILTDENKENHQLYKYEICLVYKEYPDGYLVAANDILGIVPKSHVTELKGAYAVVDLSDQKVDIYRDNELVLSTPCTTGKDATPTTVGCHQIHSEKHHDYLVGPDYKSYVTHFLAFHNGEGFHDASWRSVFGNDGYHENGSHGCVNLPEEVIEEVNNTLDTGDTVIVKH